MPVCENKRHIFIFYSLGKIPRRLHHVIFVTAAAFIFPSRLQEVDQGNSTLTRPPLTNRLQQNRDVNFIGRAHHIGREEIDVPITD